MLGSSASSSATRPSMPPAREWTPTIRYRWIGSTSSRSRRTGSVGRGRRTGTRCTYGAGRGCGSWIEEDAHEEMNTPDFDTDIQAVRTALLRLRDSDELLGFDRLAGEQREDNEITQRHLVARRKLVSELIDVLDAREDIVDLQALNGLDPLELLLGDELES